MKNSSSSWSKLQEKVYSTTGKDEATRSLKTERVKLLLNYVGSKKRVLDLGCGDGGACNVLHEKSNEVVGVDLEGVVEIAKQKYPHLKFISADLSQKFPFADHEFDIIYASEIIEHIPDDKYFLQECFRVLKRGGMLIITTPNLAYIRNRYYLLIGRSWYDHIKDTDTHIHDLYTPKSFVSLLKFIGFKITKVTSAPYEGGGIWYRLEKLLPSQFGNTIVVKCIRP